MSRSYKRYPVLKAKDHDMQKIANRKVRRMGKNGHTGPFQDEWEAFQLPSGNQYRKAANMQYDICDWVSIAYKPWHVIKEGIRERVILKPVKYSWVPIELSAKDRKLREENEWLARLLGFEPPRRMVVHEWEEVVRTEYPWPVESDRQWYQAVSK